MSFSHLNNTGESLCLPFAFPETYIYIFIIFSIHKRTWLSMSTSLPLPSSPHCVPSTTHTCGSNSSEPAPEADTGRDACGRRAARFGVEPPQRRVRTRRNATRGVIAGIDIVTRPMEGRHVACAQPRPVGLAAGMGSMATSRGWENLASTAESARRPGYSERRRRYLEEFDRSNRRK